MRFQLSYFSQGQEIELHRNENYFNHCDGIIKRLRTFGYNFQAGN